MLVEVITHSNLPDAISESSFSAKVTKKKF